MFRRDDDDQHDPRRARCERRVGFRCRSGRREAPARGPGNKQLLPGGKAPAELRQQPSALVIARGFMTAGKPVAAICHGAQILASACHARTASELSGDCERVARGGRALRGPRRVRDGNLITSRRPAGLACIHASAARAVGRVVATGRTRVRSCNEQCRAAQPARRLIAGRCASRPCAPIAHVLRNEAARCRSARTGRSDRRRC